MVQIETNGLLPHRLPPRWIGDSGLTVVCSPKKHVIHPRNEGVIDAVKYIIKAGELYLADGLPVGIARVANAEVFVQPMDEKDESYNRANLEAALESCYRFGYRLSIQTHKLLGLP